MPWFVPRRRGGDQACQARAAARVPLDLRHQRDQLARIRRRLRVVALNEAVFRLQKTALRIREVPLRLRQVQALANRVTDEVVELPSGNQLLDRGRRQSHLIDVPRTEGLVAYTA